MKANILQELVAKWRREVARHEASEASRNDECATCAALTFEECADELQAALDAQTGGWQPIESAPRDGSSILLAERDAVTAGFYHDGSQCYGHRGEAGFFDESDRGSLLTASNFDATHWMPLPAGPVEGGGT